jgi:acetyltransferase-like isoleucine patch superfamily enzyme
MEGAMLSKTQGVQASVFGRDSFVAIGATFFDFSFGKPIRVLDRGKRVNSGTRFLGSCIGHRVKIGPHVRIGYGQTVANDSFIVADPNSVLRISGQVEPLKPHAVVTGALQPIKPSES